MRVERLSALILIVPFFSCSDQDNAGGVAGAQGSAQLKAMHARPAAAFKPFDFDIVQRTCAMYVAMHSRAFNASVAFDRTIDDAMVHWNKCPSGNMVACAEISTVTDSVQAGIPWPY